MTSSENTIILETTQGRVSIEMRPDLAPRHVARIKELVKQGFYDGVAFHRVIDGFMAQTVCPRKEYRGSVEGIAIGGHSRADIPPGLRASDHHNTHLRLLQFLLLAFRLASLCENCLTAQRSYRDECTENFVFCYAAEISND